MFNPNEIDIRSVSNDEAVVELDRELQLRASVYGKWIEENRLALETGTARFAAMKKARAIVNYMRGNADRIKLGLRLLEIAEKTPEKLVAVAQTIQAFPGATIGDIEQKMKEAA
ncbi:hypothetical protein [uncultured Hyphomicrobium sp.]|uniref:hypothetical protein n=1 Tax=uncultured Hyphomicrobium sp. TaxID=194373 RepID=UPI0025D7279D|nr:hypothetical protein [uncultured Hyphomicrobium sp.]